ncbi:MAG TPA: GNAT family N-acetyltransferase [Steroidobacteraceae bacterium]|nr:GNAT family N-acetyltransferase [Steroidobacteraceae bacterium]
MSARVRILPVGTADVRDLLPLVEQYWRFEAIEGFDGARIAGLLERVIAQPALGRAWLARVDDLPAGYLLAVYVFSLEHQGLTAEIDEFFVLPPHRRLGLGGQLLRTAEVAFRAHGCTNVSLQIGRDNAEARAFYRRHGYGDRDRFELVDKTL